MSKKTDINNKVKDSFDSIRSTAPAGLWEGISEGLDISPADQALDSKLKESFTDQGVKAPDKVWSNVNRQLNIDKVWKGTLAALIKITLFRRLRRVAALLLLLLLGWGGYSSFDGQRYSDSDNSEIKEVADASTPIVGDEDQDIRINDPGVPVSNGSDLEGQTNTAEPVYSTNEQDSKPEGELTQKGSAVGTKTNFQISNVNGAGNDEFMVATASSTPANIESGTVLPEINTPEGLSVETSNAVSVALEEMIALDILLNNGAPSWPEPIIKDHQDPANKNKLNGIEVGLTYSYNNTWILNNETSAAFDPNSLVSTKATYAGSYGIEASVRLSPNHALTTQVYINSKVKQDYGVYIEGRHTEKRVEVNYMKFTLMYKMTYPQFNKKFNTRYTIQVGPYLAKLKSQSVYYGDELVAISSDYSEKDLGIKLALGQEKTFGRIIVCYGLNGEYGLVNIFTGSGRLTPKFDDTRNANIGGYLSLKYGF